MKKLFNKSFASFTMAIGFAALQLSCSSDSKTTANQESATTNSTGSESEAAYTDYKNYVSTLDTSATANRDTASASWKDQRSMYDKKVARMDQFTNEYDESRRQEIDQLKSRYFNYWNVFGTSQNGGITPKAVPGNPVASADELKLSDFNTASITASTPLAIRQAYERFVAKVQAQKENFTKEDWKQVEAYYQALDDRKNQMQGKLSDKDKLEIGKAKAKYVAMKTGEKVDPDMRQVAQDVKQTGKKVGDKAENTAEKVGNAAKNTGKDVKETAKETGKDVKEATVKGAKAVGNTAKKAVDKVDDALVGKKE